MKNYEVTFNVNGKRTVQVVAANMSSDAKKLIEAQYSGSRISFIKVSEVKK